MSEWRLERYRTAYLAMAKHAHYRPAAPSDGFGNIEMRAGDLRDPAILQQEALRYARGFLAEDNAMEYALGCPDGRGNRAFCYVIEAARALCGAVPELAEQLLKMAIDEIAAEYPDRGPLNRGKSTRTNSGEVLR